LPVNAIQDQGRQGLERWEHAMACIGHRFQAGNLTPTQSLLQGRTQLLYGHGVGQVTLVELENERQVVQVLSVLRQVLTQVGQGLEVGFKHVCRRVGYKNHPVCASEHELAGGVVVDLPRHSVQLETSSQAGHGAQIQGHEVEE
jgi:hypothetical protein